MIAGKVAPIWGEAPERPKHRSKGLNDSTPTRKVGPTTAPSRCSIVRLGRQTWHIQGTARRGLRPNNECSTEVACFLRLALWVYREPRPTNLEPIPTGFRYSARIPALAGFCLSAEKRRSR